MTEYSHIFERSTLLQPNRRKVFISHYHGHPYETNDFLQKFSDVFIRRSVGALGDQDFINSADTEYVMRRIRADYIGDSTVTIILVGKCTHSRRYVDWEIKGSLQQGADRLPNGLIAIQMPSGGPNGVYLPPRLEQNWNSQLEDCYARFYRYPQSKEELRGWIEEAYAARSNRAKWIKNPHDTMFGYDRSCIACGVRH